MLCSSTVTPKRALERSCVQELAVPTILAGGSVVLAAETGSGKTLAYILPIASSLLRLRAAREDGSRWAGVAASQHVLLSGWGS
jgi:superfamily II DNA/RNA helicase